MDTVIDELNELMHIGVPRRSGRYPWGSGDDPYQHGQDLLGRIELLKKSGWTETPENIKKEFNMSTGQYRAEKAVATNARKMLDQARMKSLRDDGLGYTEIGKLTGYSESTVRSMLSEKTMSRTAEAQKTADFLKEQIKEKKMIEVGVGVERELGVSETRLQQALTILQAEGYELRGRRVDQANNPGKKTTITALCEPGAPKDILYKNLDQLKTVTEYQSRDGGETFSKTVYPKSMDSKRLMIRYKEDGGIEKDGIIELRRGVDDLSLGESRYAQVRILVDNNKYLKGMAVYSDKMPDGVDVIFNTNKGKDTPKMEVLKNIKDDPDNPFGATIKPKGQYTYIDKNGKEQLGLINQTRSEGDWNDWKDALPSQFLSKQSLSMAKKQLNLAATSKAAEFDEIMSLTNPTVKKHLLQKFSDECDSAAVHLQAAALPGQKYHVIIPVTSMKDNEVYAPGYESGTKLALVRYPHGGTFEIPILTVNNKQPTARKLLGTDAVDAVAINAKVAERLSGADFDGDTVMCIPTHDSKGKVKVSSTPPLKDLEGFDPKADYGTRKVVGDDGETRYYRGDRAIKVMTPKQKQIQMGIASNLIADMTLKGASPEELAKAVKHSMVVIDAEKHKLDFKQSEIDNDIASLKKKYQSGGASTLITRAKSPYNVDKRQGTPKVNLKGKDWYDPTRPEGALIYTTAADKDLYYQPRYKKDTGTHKKGEPMVNKDGTPKIVKRTESVAKMTMYDDARKLISTKNTKMEQYYADYANQMKSLANRARVEMMTAGKVNYSQAAEKTYRAEVDSLMSKLNTALLNAPRERYAQILTNVAIDNKKKAAKASGKELTKEEIKKAGQQALSKYRDELGSVARRDRSIKITDREWEAIQAGAISETKLKKILNNTDVDSLRERATPRTTTAPSNAQVARMKALNASNYTLEEIAKKMGYSTTTVSKYLKGAN